MSIHLGVTLTNAKPMTRRDYNIFRGWELPANEWGKDKGYLVHNVDGHLTWWPKKVFDRKNIALTKHNTITQKDVDNMIDQIHIDTIEPNDSGTKVTIVTVTLINGFTITESSSCVDPDNYDHEIGLMACMEKIESKVWFLLGFLLSCGLNGFQKEKV